MPDHPPASETARRNAANRRRGKGFERELLSGARELGLDMERTRDTGRLDEGDLLLRMGDLRIVVEAKNAARMDAAGFLTEAQAEAGHYAARRGLDPAQVHGVAVVKRRGKGWQDAYALLTVRDYLRLARLAAGA